MSISRIIIVAPLVAIIKYQAQAIWNTLNSSNNHGLGAGGRHGRSHANVRLKNSRFFVFKISKSVACKSLTSAKRASRTRPGRVLASLPSLALCFQPRFSIRSFCLTARAYLNTQKYGLFCSLR